MSTAAVNSYPVAQGATARALPGLRPGLDQPRKARTPLSVVRSVPRKRRAPFVVLCFGLLAIALMAVLVLNISVSSAQYQLVQLRSEQTTLTKQNQDLTQQVQNFDAPQNLAAKATELGMVASVGKGQIDLSTLRGSATFLPTNGCSDRACPSTRPRASGCHRARRIRSARCDSPCRRSGRWRRGPVGSSIR